jgi:hypothetical protein
MIALPTLIFWIMDETTTVLRTDGSMCLVSFNRTNEQAIAAMIPMMLMNRCILVNELEGLLMVKTDCGFICFAIMI